MLNPSIILPARWTTHLLLGGFYPLPTASSVANSLDGDCDASDWVLLYGPQMLTLEGRRSLKSSRDRCLVAGAYITDF
jgi:hypothetical protein